MAGSTPTEPKRVSAIAQAAFEPDLTLGAVHQIGECPTLQANIQHRQLHDDSARHRRQLAPALLLLQHDQPRPLVLAARLLAAIRCAVGARADGWLSGSPARRTTTNPSGSSIPASPSRQDRVSGGRHVRVLGQGHLRGVGVVIGEPVSGVVFSDDPGRAINLGAGRDSDVVNRKQAGNPMR